jgi:ribosomal protein S27AE
MTSRKHCPKCGGEMNQGFVIDAGDSGSHRASKWQAGTPQKSFWTGIKLSKADQHEVVTWRCGRCGFLESYAGVS